MTGKLLIAGHLQDTASADAKKFCGSLRINKGFDAFHECTLKMTLVSCRVLALGCGEVERPLNCRGLFERPVHGSEVLPVFEERSWACTTGASDLPNRSIERFVKTASEEKLAEEIEREVLAIIDEAA